MSTDADRAGAASAAAVRTAREGPAGEPHVWRRIGYVVVVVAAVAFQGTRRMLALAQVENAQELVRLFLVVLGAAITGSPEGAVIGTLVSSAIGSLLAVELYRAARHDGGYPLPGVMEIARAAPEIPILRGLRLGIRVGVLKNTNAMVLSIIPRLIIGGVAGLSWVAYFHIAHRILSIPTMFMLGVSRTTLPALGELAGKRDMEGFRRLFTRATLLTGGILSAAILVSLPLVRPLTALLFPPDYPTPVFHFTWILALGYIPFAYYAPHKDRMKALAIVAKPGEKGVLPSLDAVKAGSYQPLSRPLFVYVGRKAAEKPEVKRFVEFFLTEGPALIEEVGYMPLPAGAYETARARFAAGTVGTVFGGVPEVGIPVEELLQREAKH